MLAGLSPTSIPGCWPFKRFADIFGTALAEKTPHTERESMDGRNLVSTDRARADLLRVLTRAWAFVRPYFFGNDSMADRYALIAYLNRRPRDHFPYVTLRLVAERTAKNRLWPRLGRGAPLPERHDSEAG